MRSHIVLKICKKRGVDQKVSKASDETRKSAEATVTKQVVGQPQLFWEPHFLQQKTDSGLSQPLPLPGVLLSWEGHWHWSLKPNGRCSLLVKGEAELSLAEALPNSEIL